MGYQSKTYSLSDEVIEQIDAAREKGITPNQFLKALMFSADLDAVSPPAGSKVGKRMNGRGLEPLLNIQQENERVSRKIVPSKPPLLKPSQKGK